MILLKIQAKQTELPFPILKKGFRNVFKQREIQEVNYNYTLNKTLNDSYLK